MIRPDAAREALHLLHDGRYKQALRSARAGLKKAPDPVLFNVCGVALGAMGKPREAIPEFTRALRAAPGFDEARRNLAQTLLLIGEGDKARDQLTRLIARAPGDDAALCLLAQAALSTGDADAALDHARAAAGAAPGRARNHHMLGLVHEALGQTEGALAAFRAASDLDPASPDLLIAVSRALSRQAQPEPALAALHRAVAVAPLHAGAQLALARQLSATGAGDAAIAAALAALDLATAQAAPPLQAEAIELLASLQGAEANRALARHVPAVLKALPQRAEGRAALLFAQARMAEQSGRADDARQHRTAANREMARLLPHDPAADAALHAALAARFPVPATPARPAEASDTGDATAPRPIHIVGLPRSGTTLAEAILGAHPHVTALGERATAAALLRHVIDRNLPFDSAAVAAFRDGEIAQLPALPPGTLAWTDKMPENYRLAGFLATAWPRGRILNITRDPRDIALSMWRGRFQGTALAYTYDLAAMAARFNAYARLMRHWHTAFPGRILDIAYEDMVGDITRTSQRIATFCGLDWVEAMTRPDEAAGQILTLSATQLRQPVHGRSVGGWRSHADELAPFLAGLDPALWPGAAD